MVQKGLLFKSFSFECSENNSNKFALDKTCIFLYFPQLKLEIMRLLTNTKILYSLVKSLLIGIVLEKKK